MFQRRAKNDGQNGLQKGTAATATTGLDETTCMNKEKSLKSNVAYA